MTLIIDASVALKWFMEEPGSGAARSILESEEWLPIAALGSTLDPGRQDNRPPRRWINCFRIIVPTA